MYGKKEILIINLGWKKLNQISICLQEEKKQPERYKIKKSFSQISNIFRKIETSMKACNLWDEWWKLYSPCLERFAFFGSSLLQVLLSPSAARLQQALEDAQTSFADSKATSDIGASGFSSDDATGGRTTGERTFVTIIVLVFPVKLYSDTLTLNLCVWPMVWLKLGGQASHGKLLFSPA